MLKIRGDGNRKNLLQDGTVFLPSQALSCAGYRVLSQLLPVGIGTPEIQTVKRTLKRKGRAV